MAYGATFFSGRSVGVERGNVDLLARAALEHMAADRLREQKRSFEVDIEDEVVVLLAHFDRRFAAVDSGDVDQRIDPAMGFDHVGDQPLDRRVVSHIAHAAFDPAGVGECLPCLVDRLLAAAGENHGRFPLSESPRDRPADAARSAGDEDGLIGDGEEGVGHGRLLSGSILDFGFWISDFRFQISDFRFQISDFRFQICRPGGCGRAKRCPPGS